MSEDYQFFMLFNLDDDGHRVRLQTTEHEFKENNGLNFLHPEQVFVIVKEEIRRIYIWKGSKSPVRQRFISSRIASQLQEELVKQAAFHRCKIVSVDQGDEPNDFLKAFQFKTMPVTEKLADMHYIRNVDRERMEKDGIAIEEGPKVVKIEPKKKIPLDSIKSIPQTRTKKVTQIPSSQRVSTASSYRPPPRQSSLSKSISSELSDEKIKGIKEKILNTDLPKGYSRQNLILGHNLYGAVIKTVNVLGKNIKDTTWEIVKAGKAFPKGMIELDGRKIRAYFNEKDGIVEAIEILKRGEGAHVAKKKPTPKKRPAPKKKTTAKKRSTAKKRPAAKKGSSTKRNLPKVPRK